MVDELVEAQHDDDIIEYRREAHPVLPSVYVTLAAADYEGVVAVADRYRDVEEIEYVSVVSGGFTLSRDKVNDPQSRARARERFALDVNRRFRLTGAVVVGRGPLRLAVPREERAALRAYVKRHAAEQNLGRVIVGAKATLRP